MKRKGAFFVPLLAILIAGCPRCWTPPVVYSGNAIVQGEIRKATLTWDQSCNTGLIQIPPIIQTEYAIRYDFSFREEDFTVKKLQITPNLTIFNYSAEIKDPSKTIEINIVQQPKDGDPRWPCAHDFDDEVITVLINRVRFIARTITPRSTNPLNGIRYKFFPCT